MTVNLSFLINPSQDLFKWCLWDGNLFEGPYLRTVDQTFPLICSVCVVLDTWKSSLAQ